MITPISTNTPISSQKPAFRANITYRVSQAYPENANAKYLFNEMLSVVKDQKLPAAFHSQHIDVSFDSKYQQKNIELFKNTLNTAGIKFKQLI